MGQKINPHGFRVGVIKDWDSRWFANDKDFGDILVEDYHIRKFLKKTLYQAGVSRIEIERDATKVRVHVNCAKPGIVIGKGGSEIEKVRNDLDALINKDKKDKKAIYINVVEVKQPDLDAQLVAENIAQQLEKRISYRRAMKMSMGRTMRMGAKGIKTQVGGRLGGTDIARSEHYHEGTIPLQTIRADISYGFAEADTTYGKLGVKVWIYLGEILKLQDARDKRAENAKRELERKKRPQQRPAQRRPAGNRSSQASNAQRGRAPQTRDTKPQERQRGRVSKPQQEKSEGGKD